MALEVTVAKKDEPHTFKTDRQTLRVASFNSLKLRTGRAGLAEHWYQLAATLSTVDCLMVQEVPNEGSCKDFESTRAFELKRLLEHQTNSKWTAVRSEPSGPGNLEVHVWRSYRTRHTRRPVVFSSTTRPLVSASRCPSRKTPTSLGS